MELTQAIVRELLDYDAETGLLYWKPRDVKWFINGSVPADRQAKRWNSVFAGKQAFTAINGKGHKQGSILGKFTKAHRVIWLWMTGETPIQVDHENGNPSDNRWINLRNVTNAENQRNVSLRRDSKTGFTGVTYVDRQRNKWVATIYHAGKNLVLGSFETKEEAIQARTAANIKFGYHPNHGREKVILARH